jgi:hypothetical protein
MYFYAEINACRGYRKHGMLGRFVGETKDPCEKYHIADFKGKIKLVNEELKTAVFSLGNLDLLFNGVPVFEVPSESIREQLRSHIGGSDISFSVRNGQVVEVNE